MQDRLLYVTFLYSAADGAELPVVWERVYYLSYENRGVVSMTLFSAVNCWRVYYICNRLKSFSWEPPGISVWCVSREASEFTSEGGKVCRNGLATVTGSASGHSFWIGQAWYKCQDCSITHQFDP